MDKKRFVVVTGRNYCNLLTTARDLGEAGYFVKIVRIFKNKVNPLNLLRRMHPESKSKYVIDYKEVIVSNDGNNVIDILLSIKDDEKTLLIPVDDYMVSLIDTNYDTLRSYYMIPNIDDTQNAIQTLMDKNKQKENAEKANLPLLHSCLITSNNGMYTIPDDVHYPCFIKPNISMKSTKNKMRKCDSYEELKQTLDSYASKEDFEMLVEEYADIKQEYSILGVCTNGKAETLGLFRVLQGGHKERKGVTLVGEMLPVHTLQTIISKCDRYVESLHYTGIYDIDLLETKDGNIYFIEINFRAGASTRALTVNGINLFQLLCDSMLLQIDSKTNFKEYEKQTFISEKVLQEEYARGDISFKEVKQLMKEVNIHFIYDDRDAKPYQYFKKFYAFAYLMRVAYKFKH